MTLESSEYDPYAPRVPESARRAAARRGGEPLPIDPQEPAMFDDKETGAEVAQTVAAGQLRAFIERVERLEEEKKTIAQDISEIYSECKGTGFDVKAVKQLVRLRKQDQAERQEAEAILDLYKAALGMA